jgi:RNA polymerase sigma-70 factor (ECF subfamily)
MTPPPRDLLDGIDHAQRLAAQHGFVRALARRLVAPWAADDVAQEVLVAGLEHPPREPSALRSWLSTATRNLASKWQRGEGRRATRERAVAQHEALPSTHELVERVELGQQLVRAVLALGEPERTTLLLRFHEGLSTAEIAAREGLAADTVRSRLRRGLALLRTRLDERYGEHAWTPLLLPLAGWKSVAEATVAATTAAAAGTTGGAALTATGGAMAGAAVMAAKSWIVGGLATATLVVAGVGTSSSWLPLLGVRAAPNRIEQPQAASGPGAADFGALPQPVDALAAQREAVAREEGGEGGNGVAAALPPAGTVKLTVVDRDTGAPLDRDVSIRFLSEKRFAAHDGGGAVEAALTAGRWSARVQARGYEPSDVDAFEVVAGLPNDLGPIALARGNGVVEGNVVARHLGGAEPVVVELRGLGRRRCDACVAAVAQDGEPRHACGEGDDPTWFRLEGERRFRFDGLAQGSYFLRAFDPQQRIVDLRRIEIARGGYLWQELEVSAPTSARFELRHARGALFQGDWQGVHSEAPATITFEILRGEQVVARAEIVPTPDDVRLSVGAPAVALAKDEAAEKALLASGDFVHAKFAEQLLTQWMTAEGGAAVKLGAFNLTFATTAADDRLDRERTEADTLLFDVPVPALDAAPLQIVKLRPDSFELAPLPREQLTVKVRCGGYESDPIAVDLRYGEPLPTVIALHPSAARLEELAWLALGQPESCTKCHEQRRDNGASIIFSQNIELSFDSNLPELSRQIEVPEGSAKDQ